QSVVGHHDCSKAFRTRHSGMERSTRPQMCHCTSGNPWIPGSMRSLSSGRPEAGPVGIVPELLTLVRREKIQPAIATGALDIGLRAPAVRSLRGMRAVAGCRLHMV